MPWTYFRSKSIKKNYPTFKTYASPCAHIISCYTCMHVLYSHMCTRVDIAICLLWGSYVLCLCVSYICGVWCVWCMNRRVWEGVPWPTYENARADVTLSFQDRISHWTGDSLFWLGCLLTRSHRHRLPCLAFDIDASDSNSGPCACTARILSHQAISPAPM